MIGNYLLGRWLEEIMTCENGKDDHFLGRKGKSIVWRGKWWCRKWKEKSLLFTKKLFWEAWRMWCTKLRFFPCGPLFSIVHAISVPEPNVAHFFLYIFDAFEIVHQFFYCHFKRDSNSLLGFSFFILEGSKYIPITIISG